MDNALERIHAPRRRLREALDRVVLAFDLHDAALLAQAVDAGRAAIDFDNEAWAWCDQNPTAVLAALFPPPETLEEFHEE